MIYYLNKNVNSFVDLLHTSLFKTTTNIFSFKHSLLCKFASLCSIEDLLAWDLLTQTLLQFATLFTNIILIILQGTFEVTGGVPPY